MSANIAMTARFYEPPADLARYFTTFYYVDLDVPEGEPVTDALHPEWANLRIFLGDRPVSQIGDTTLADADTTVTGPSSQPLDFSVGSTRIWGIGLLPLGWATFVNIAAVTYANSIVSPRDIAEFSHLAELSDTILAPAMTEEDQLAAIIAFFRNPENHRGREDPRIGKIHAALIEPELPQVAQLAEKCCLNPRTLERLSIKHFGFPPKLLLRRQRFMRSLAQFMLDPDLGWIGAIDSLYCDQSHFVRDCQYFLRRSPREYAAIDHPIMAVFLRERMRAHGSAVQTLDDPHMD